MESRKVELNRFIQLKDGVVGPVPPKQKTVKIKQVGDYRGTPEAYLDIAENYGPKFTGPPLCDELMALVQHMFTEEEASVMRYLKPGRMWNAQDLAKVANLPVEEVAKVLERMAHEKRIILSFGPSYMLIPILPGAFELVLIRTTKDTLTEWHRKFAELFEKLWETGVVLGHSHKQPPDIRFLPLQSIMKTHPMALPSDMLEEVLDPYKSFAVGLCQCRLTEELVGRGCGKPMNNCTAMGALADMGVASGQMRRVEKKDLIEIKLEAENSGLVNWIMTRSMMPGTNTMCSCCGCCCHAMRTITEFNMPGMLAPPHFMPEVDHDKCTYCGNCAKACPMGAITVDMKGKTHSLEPVRCVGCGQCFVACDKKQAISLEPVEGYVVPKII